MNGPEDFLWALDAAVQWLQTYRANASPRALETALACAAIARERFHGLKLGHISNAMRRQMLTAERLAQHEAHMDEIREGIEECRRTLEGLD
jgi:hypothetical protein